MTKTKKFLFIHYHLRDGVFPLAFLNSLSNVEISLSADLASEQRYEIEVSGENDDEILRSIFETGMILQGELLLRKLQTISH